MNNQRPGYENDDGEDPLSIAPAELRRPRGVFPTLENLTYPKWLPNPFRKNSAINACLLDLQTTKTGHSPKRKRTDTNVVKIYWF